ncbi:conserved hypothetical protein [Parafrankia sp. EAN1pec]|uniref:glycosyltransferase family 39 protein n=1 Tax=Parafrankia sp. (strain EAN1pec) TaxID=298653 RepID=UPI00015DA083|nr:conserved hypothetical protein [Frankia sp. EAN1pec]
MDVLSDEGQLAPAPRPPGAHRPAAAGRWSRSGGRPGRGRLAGSGQLPTQGPSDPGARSAVPPRLAPAGRAWWIGLLVVVAVGLGVRLGYLFGWMHPAVVDGDPFYYHQAANLFADGHGWPDPYELRYFDRYVPDAQHPPLTSALLAIPSVLGFTGFLSHQIFSCLLGAVSVGVVGLVGRRAAGPATGLLAAGIAALYPGMWLNDALVMSETTGILTCALLIAAAHRFWDRRTVADACWLGAALAAAMLARAELALLALVLVVPLIAMSRPLPWRRRLGLLAAAAGTSVAVVAPWTAYNLSRFEEPEFLSTGLGSTLAVTHCEASYFGKYTGWWSFDCIQALEQAPVERSERDVYYRKAAYRFIGDNTGELPRVAAARAGRTWGLYRPWQQTEFDGVELRPLGLSRLGMVCLWVLELAAVAGTMVLRRRGVVLLPLLAVPITLTLASVLVYGTTRFRACAEPAVVLLAAVGIAAIVGALRRRRAGLATAEAQRGRVK